MEKADLLSGTDSEVTDPRDAEFKNEGNRATTSKKPDRSSKKIDGVKLEHQNTEDLK